jgi:peptidylprolyl isomerase domain and WD repeat-containing protein 1
LAVPVLCVQAVEQLQAVSALGLDSMDFGRRSAVEYELESSPAMATMNAVFDESGHFLIYGTLIGIKVLNIETNRVVKVREEQKPRPSPPVAADLGPSHIRRMTSVKQKFSA